MNNRHQFVQTSAAAAVLGSLALPAFAQAQTQTLPLEQVKIINGFPVGGSADTTSRRVGEKLGSSAFTKNPVVVENKTGAAARIGIEAVKAAAPDGATLLLTPYSMMAIYPHIYKQLSYDPFIDLMPVCMAWPNRRILGPLVPKHLPASLHLPTPQSTQHLRKGQSSTAWPFRACCRWAVPLCKWKLTRRCSLTVGARLLKELALPPKPDVGAWRNAAEARALARLLRNSGVDEILCVLGL